MTPRVSVCVPAYQAAPHLQEVLDAVYAQDFEDFELVVVDDGSRDETPAILAAQTDPRLRFTRRDQNLGQEATVAETIGRARTDLVKFLDADDILHRDCLSTLVAAMDAHPSASMGFCRRDILVSDPEDEAYRGWLEKYAELHVGFGGLDELNDGEELLRRVLGALIQENWVAEPAGVIARRADLLAVGGYNLRVRQNNDIDLWLRLMARGDVVFVDRSLYDYRLEVSGVTGASAASGHQWLDPLWTVEGLAGIDGFPAPAAVREARRNLLRSALRQAAASPLHERGEVGSRLADLAAYGRHRAARRLGRGSRLYQPIET